MTLLEALDELRAAFDEFTLVAAIVAADTYTALAGGRDFAPVERWIAGRFNRAADEATGAYVPARSRGD